MVGYCRILTELKLHESLAAKALPTIHLTLSPFIPSYELLQKSIPCPALLPLASPPQTVDNAALSWQKKTFLAQSK